MIARLLKSRLSNLLRSSDGNATIEFAIIAPAMLTLLMGVFQVGVGMQAHNALRAIAMDTARHSAIEYQQNKTLSNDDIATWARARAVNAPYLLSEGNLLVTAVPAATQRVTGASERTLNIRYAVPSFLSIIGINSYYINYSRPIFVPT